MFPVTSQEQWSNMLKVCATNCVPLCLPVQLPPRMRTRTLQAVPAQQPQPVVALAMMSAASRPQQLHPGQPHASTVQPASSSGRRQSTGQKTALPPARAPPQSQQLGQKASAAVSG